MRQRPTAIALCAMGTLLAIYVVLFKQQGGYGDSADFLYSMFQIAGPWIVLDTLLVWFKRYRGVILSGSLMLLLEIYIYYGVFINPRSSTDAIAYVFKPALQLLLILPISLLIGHAMDKRATATCTK